MPDNSREFWMGAQGGQTTRPNLKLIMPPIRNLDKGTPTIWSRRNMLSFWYNDKN